MVVQEAGASPNTIRRGIREIEAEEGYTPGERQRQSGGGRKKLIEKDAMLQADLEGLLDPKGDPMSLLRWTCKSVAHLKTSVQAMGHQIADTALRDLLRTLGYRLAANKKNLEGYSHEDRDAQFAQIKAPCEQCEQRGEPIISVDCKKKELIGNFKNNGAEWQAKGEQTNVNVSDFLSLADGKVIPDGVYDLVHNQGFVNVGIDHETAEFAVASIKRWWQEMGKALYPGKSHLLITADRGGSNGVRNRLWKKKFQDFANEESSASQWPTIRQPPASGTRVSIACLLSFRSTGEPGRSPRWRSFSNSSPILRHSKA